MTFDLFFYGTLRDPAVRGIVLGLDIDPAQTEAATLDGYRCAPVENGRFPGLVRSASDSASGMLVRAVPLKAAVRTSFFEGEVADYTVAEANVRLASGPTVAAWVYLPTTALALGDGYWSIEAWKRTYRDGFIRDAEEHMAQATPQALAVYREGWLSRLP